MAISGLKNRIIAKTLSSPRWGRAADVFGRVMSKATFGHYRTGLSRTAMQLSSAVKEGEILKVTRGLVYSNGKLINYDPVLFNGIEREVKVTPEMCTAGGMASALRWDLIGNAPEFYAAAISVASKAIILGLYSSAHHDPAFDRGFYSILFALSVIPFHRIIRLCTGSRDKEIKLTNVEGHHAKIKYQTGSIWKAGEAPFDDRTVITVKTSSIDRDPVIAHEKAHLLGASEYSALRIMREKFLKQLIYEKKGLFSKFEYLDKSPTSIMLTLFDTFLHNVGAIIYAIKERDPYNFYREYFHLKRENNGNAC